MKLQHRKNKGSGFTLIEIMLVIATIALLAVIAVPNYFRSRKRSQAVRVLVDIRALDSAIDQYTIEYHRSGQEAIGPGDIDYFKKYIKPGTKVYESLPNDLLGNPYTMTILDSVPKVSDATFAAFSDVAGLDFWSPYYP